MKEEMVLSSKSTFISANVSFSNSSLLKLLLGLKKSPSLLVATPHVSEKAMISGFSFINIATAPAPCVYSPVECSSYFAISDAITIACRFSPALIQSMLLCNASTPPTQANVISSTSQFLNTRSPNLFLSFCSAASTA